MEYKKLPQLHTKTIHDRTATGIFAVHGHLDDGNDISHPGAFGDAMVNGRSRAKFLWMHDGKTPPIARIDNIRDVGRHELPELALKYAPDATGGTEVTRTYNASPLAEWVLMGLKDGSIDEMSYGYVAHDPDFESKDGVQVRNLRKMGLYDVSDVNWGMSDATIGAKGEVLTGLPLASHSDAVLAAVDELKARLVGLRDLRAKEGRVLSDANRKRIAGLKDALAAVLTDLDDLLTMTTPSPDAANMAKALYLESQRILATLNGVPL